MEQSEPFKCTERQGEGEGGRVCVTVHMVVSLLHSIFMNIKYESSDDTLAYVYHNQINMANSGTCTRRAHKHLSAGLLFSKLLAVSSFNAFHSPYDGTKL